MPADDSFYRNLKTVHVVFALSAAALLGTTLWMMAADNADEWHHYQNVNEKIRVARIRAEQEDYKNNLQFQQEKDQYDAELKSAQEALDARKDRKEELERELAQLNLKVDLQDVTVREERAQRDVANANYDLGVRDGLDEQKLAALKAGYDRRRIDVEQLELELQQLETARNTKQAELDDLLKDVTEAQAELKRIRTDVVRLDEALASVEPEGWFSSTKRKMMKWPIINGFNSPQAIKQDWLPDLKITLGMARTARFDRCRTCHLNIDQIASGGVPSFPHGHVETGKKSDEESVDDWVAAHKYPHPYATHPRPEVYTTASSPHPVQTFGCTICHEGQGSGTGFSTAAHYPNDPHELEEWAEEHDFATNHFWEYPMHPKRFVESSCIKCHHSVVELGVNPQYGPTAPKVARGYDLVKQYGCFGCHEIHGFDAGKPIGPDVRLEPQTAKEAANYAGDPKLVAGNMRKVGPSLRHLASKTTIPWTAYWIEEPKRFRPTTRMPQYYKLVNQLDPEKLEHGEIDWEHITLDDLDEREVIKADGSVAIHGAKVFAPVELAAMSQFLFDKSQSLSTMSPPKGYAPDAERGRVHFSQKGCLACHSHQAFPKATQDFGPDLSRVYAKIKPPADGRSPAESDGFNWLYTWILEPTRHHARTKMPNLFVNEKATDEENPAADIAAFLLEERPLLVITSAGNELDDVVDELTDSVSYTAVELRELLTSGEELPIAGLAEDAAIELKDALVEVGATVEMRSDREQLDFTHQQVVDYSDDALDELVRLNLSKLLTRPDVETVVDEPGGRFPLTGSTRLKGDEIEFVRAGEVVSAESRTQFRARFALEGYQPEAGADLVWITGENRGRRFTLADVDSNSGTLTLEEELRQTPAEGDRFMVNAPVTTEMKLNYIGRRTVTRYGCYGCHDVPGYEEARPIGTTLQDWGRKDTSKLALEHIEEFLHHHGEPDGGSTRDRALRAVGMADRDEFRSEVAADRELSVAYFYENLQHHGRPGFLWQKLRQPRSYDYAKIETKGYDERLRMPRFPLDSDEIEAISTFVLGLIAEPPAEQYLYQPTGVAADRIEGERLLEKYNCVGCHMIELPSATFALDPQTQGLPRGARDRVGMTRAEIIEWFKENHAGVLKAHGDGGGSSVAPPEQVQVILNNASDLVDPEIDLQALAEPAGDVDELKTAFKRLTGGSGALDNLSDDELKQLDADLSKWKKATADLEKQSGAAPKPPEGGQPAADPSAPLKADAAAAAGAVRTTIRANNARRWLHRLSELASQNRDAAALREWFDRRPEVMLAEPLAPAEYPAGAKTLFNLKPPRNAETGERFLSPHTLGYWLQLYGQTTQTLEQSQQTLTTAKQTLPPLLEKIEVSDDARKTLLNIAETGEWAAAAEKAFEEVLAASKKTLPPEPEPKPEPEQKDAPEKEDAAAGDAAKPAEQAAPEKPPEETEEQKRHKQIEALAGTVPPAVTALLQSRAVRAVQDAQVEQLRNEGVSPSLLERTAARLADADIDGMLAEPDSDDDPPEPELIENRERLMRYYEANHEKMRPVIGQTIVTVHGIPAGISDPEDTLADLEYYYDQWETLTIGGRHLLPANRLNVRALRLVERKEARGGEFSEWLVEALIAADPQNVKRPLAWQQSPPPLYLEGIKVQTPWLYEFLKNPNRLRHTTVLRMPQFNMDDHEIRALANYFAAFDGAQYPYQSIPQTEPEYQSTMNAAFHAEFPEKEDRYSTEAWRVINQPLCIKCHSVGGRKYQSTSKEDIRGPNLEYTADRLRPDWLMLWLYKPQWITPYTSMPQPFPHGQEQFTHLFGGNAGAQTLATRDALMMYHELMEREGRYVPEDAKNEKPAAKEKADESAEADKKSPDQEAEGNGSPPAKDAKQEQDAKPQSDEKSKTSNEGKSE